MDALTAATWSDQLPSLSAVTICFTPIIILSNKARYWQTSDFFSHSDTNEVFHPNLVASFSTDRSFKINYGLNKVSVGINNI